jgi:hypothetical protein
MDERVTLCLAEHKLLSAELGIAIDSLSVDLPNGYRQVQRFLVKL